MLMEPVKVKFGTPQPVKFREPDMTFPGTDRECEVRMAFELVVTEYDDKKYSCVDDVISKIREMSLQLVKTCLKKWPQGKSVIRSDGRAEIPEYLDREFEKAGIVTQTEIKNFSLTEESDAWYRGMIGDHSPAPIGMADWVLLHNPSSIDGVNPDFLKLKPEDLSDIFLYGGAPNGAEDKYCRQCGEKRAGNAKFCSNCGAKFG